jgi:hypothetical protein
MSSVLCAFDGSMFGRISQTHVPWIELRAAASARADAEQELALARTPHSSASHLAAGAAHSGAWIAAYTAYIREQGPSIGYDFTKGNTDRFESFCAIDAMVDNAKRHGSHISASMTTMSPMRTIIFAHIPRDASNPRRHVLLDVLTLLFAGARRDEANTIYVDSYLTNTDRAVYATALKNALDALSTCIIKMGIVDEKTAMDKLSSGDINAVGLLKFIASVVDGNVTSAFEYADSTGLVRSHKMDIDKNYLLEMFCEPSCFLFGLL